MPPFCVDPQQQIPFGGCSALFLLIIDLKINLISLDIMQSKKILVSL